MPQTPPSCTLLESRHNSLLEKLFHWHSLVSCASNLDEPILRRFRYKEGFSTEPMLHLIAEFDLIERIVTEAKN